ncbi:MAG: hypothetical protein K0S08_2104 [Gammaproteobacteria bacterium]|jgi:uncharacterized membrane protein YfcA|nr:hypothetical protein [Gammaproteobacteria bacterium]
MLAPNYHISLYVEILLALTSMFAGVIDTLAGGGGLITVPALLFAGLPPTLALGTNKLQAVIGEFNASLHFMYHGRISPKLLAPGLFAAGSGALIGAWAVQHAHPELLNKVIPYLMLAVLIYMICIGRLNKNKLSQTVSVKKFYLIAGLCIGFYNGFFGPGTGSFWVAALMIFLGFDLKKATLYGKPLNFIGNFASVFYFIFAGLINYHIAFAMALGQITGSWIGAKLVIHQGAKIIRPVFITVVFLMTVILFIKN